MVDNRNNITVFVVTLSVTWKNQKRFFGSSGHAIFGLLSVTKTPDFSIEMLPRGDGLTPLTLFTMVMVMNQESGGHYRCVYELFLRTFSTSNTSVIQSIINCCNRSIRSDQWDFLNVVYMA